MAPKDPEEVARKEYIDRDALLLKLGVEAHKSFDKILLTLSAGAIVLSVGFAEKFYSGELFVLLAIAWASWACSLSLQLYSAEAAPRGLREEQVIAGERYRKAQKRGRINQYTGTVTNLNKRAMDAFLVGMVAFLVFAAANINTVIK